MLALQLHVDPFDLEWEEQRKRELENDKNDKPGPKNRRPQKPTAPTDAPASDSTEPDEESVLEDDDAIGDELGKNDFGDEDDTLEEEGF